MCMYVCMYVYIYIYIYMTSVAQAAVSHRPDANLHGGTLLDCLCKASSRNTWDL